MIYKTLKPIAIFFAILPILVGGCGGGGSTATAPATPYVIYDEAVSGPLPYNILSFTDAELSRITFDLIEGVSVVRGTSTGGERFFVRLDASTYIKSVTIRYSTHIDNNDHVLFVSSYPASSSKITNIHHMASVGDYEFTITAADESITAGTFEIYSGTSVQGASHENPFSLTFTVSKHSV
ncbi:MAG: hypothetical protein JWL63_1387 [Rhodocyclales bacterium]|nr:hypothetical protein [Rhodocyclales bacterium]